MPAPDRRSASSAQTIFLEEEDYRRKGRVTSLRTRFRERSSGRQDEGYKGNAQTFWKVLRSRREF
ncbi:hypothetical protein HKD37_14G039344 [Glycine soja]